MTELKPTAEQATIMDACLAGGNLVIEAAAGSGKTSTLKMVAAATPKTGLYLAYNKAIQLDAQRSFPTHVRCMTSHGLAYGVVARDYRHRLGSRRIPAQQAARILHVNEPLRFGQEGIAPLAPAQLVRIATATVNRYCHSAADEITDRSVPKLNGLEDAGLHRTLVERVVPIARKIWDDIRNPNGELHFTHDHYLKMYQLTRPILDVDYLLVDEAQDLNPVVQAIVSYQKNSQVILVGDRCQAIYGWRGATDAMEHFEGDRLWLTQSFRFGPAIAAEANKWLDVIGAELRVRGFDKVHSTVGRHTAPDAVLCRTNGAAISRLMDGLTKGRRVALVGGGQDIKRFAWAARDLKAGKPTDHPELLAFSTWAEVQDYTDNDVGGSDLKVIVRLIDNHGPDALIDLAEKLVDEQYADLIVSTAHKAKGREWGVVAIADDFREPKQDEFGMAGEISREDAMLAYVAVTRAMLHLDREGLAWVDKYLRPRLVDLATGAPVPAVAPFSPAPAGVPAVAERCPRCGSTNHCACDPDAKRRWLALVSGGTR